MSDVDDAGDDNYSVEFTVSDAQLEELNKGFAAIWEADIEDGGTLVVKAGPEADADTDWLKREIGAKSDSHDSTWKRLGAIALLMAAFAAPGAAGFTPLSMLVGGGVGVLMAMWIFEEMRGGSMVGEPQ